MPNLCFSPGSILDLKLMFNAIYGLLVQMKWPARACKETPSSGGMREGEHVIPTVTNRLLGFVICQLSVSSIILSPRLQSEFPFLLKILFSLLFSSKWQLKFPIPFFPLPIVWIIFVAFKFYFYIYFLLFCVWCSGLGKTKGCAS